jgi:hypothetical protein
VRPDHDKPVPAGTTVGPEVRRPQRVPYASLAEDGGRPVPWVAQESSYAAATRLGTTMRHASTTSSRISPWSIASSHTRTQL